MLKSMFSTLFPSPPSPHSPQRAEFENHRAAMAHVLDLVGVASRKTAVTAVGHRAVHGGTEISASCLITERVKETLRKYTPLAPLHNPANLQVP